MPCLEPTAPSRPAYFSGNNGPTDAPAIRAPACRVVAGKHPNTPDNSYHKQPRSSIIQLRTILAHHPLSASLQWH